MYSCNDTLSGGLPHSDIHGSTPARGSPWLFAACHVLHRLLVPRHPPNALVILDIPAISPQADASSCTETILRLGRRSSGVGCQRQPRPNPSTVRGQSWKYMCFPHTPGSPRTAAAAAARAAGEGSIRYHPVTTPLNPRRRPLGDRSCERPIPVRQVSRTTHLGQRSARRRQSQTVWSDPSARHAARCHDDAPRDAPEPDSQCNKEQRHPTGQHKRRDTHPKDAWPGVA